MDKDKWIDGIISSLDGLQPAAPPLALHKKIMQQLDNEKLGAVGNVVSMQTVYRVAAAIAVIISINAYSCIVFSKNQEEKKTVEAFEREYSLTSSASDWTNI
jgi:hypothetical protein